MPPALYPSYTTQVTLPPSGRGTTIPDTSVFVGASALGPALHPANPRASIPATIILFVVLVIIVLPFLIRLETTLKLLVVALQLAYVVFTPFTRDLTPIEAQMQPHSVPQNRQCQINVHISNHRFPSVAVHTLDEAGLN